MIFDSTPIAKLWGLKTVRECQKACEEDFPGCKYFYRRDGTDWINEEKSQPKVCLLYNDMPHINGVDLGAHGMIFGSVDCKGTSEICASMFEN